MDTIKHTDKLFEVTSEKYGKLLYFWCPGCGHCHSFEVPRWNFNGDFHAPTFSPSLRVFTRGWTDKESGEIIPERTVCHLFLEQGMIKYCGDSPHKLAGQNVPMEPIPSDYGGFI